MKVEPDAPPLPDGKAGGAVGDEVPHNGGHGTEGASEPAGPAASGYEWLGDSPTEPLDPEEIARRFNEQRQAEALPGLDGLFGGDGMAGDLPPGEYHVEAPEGIPKVSTTRETVYLPVKVRVMYDYCRSKGWHQGDGGLSAFVWDFLLCHFQTCMGLEVYVAPRQEVAVA